MIVAPLEKLNLQFEFRFYFMSIPFKFAAKISIFRCNFCLKLFHLIYPSFFLFLFFFSISPSQLFKKSLVNLKIKKTALA